MAEGKWEKTSVKPTIKMPVFRITQADFKMTEKTLLKVEGSFSHTAVSKLKKAN